MSLTICWYESETEKEEEKVLSKLREFRRYLDSDTGKVLIGAHKVLDDIDDFINEATMAIMASGIKLPAEWSELSLEQRIVAETREINLLSSRYLKLNYQLFAESGGKIAYVNKATSGFWKLYEKLSTSIQRVADEKFSLFKQNPELPGLNFEKLKGFDNKYSIRINDQYRAIGTKEGNVMRWTEIIPHTYNKAGR